MGAFTGDKHSVLFQGLSGFWQRFFADAADLEVFYQASETYLGQVYLDLMASVLGTGLVDTPIFNKEHWKLFAIDETEINYSKGPTTEDDRFVYDPPGAIVNLHTLQNSIFDPQVVLDNGVDFYIEDNDGLVRFTEDPFRAVLDSDGSYQPTPGVAWRKITKAVGNRFSDRRMGSIATTWDWYESGVRRGDTLRFISRTAEQLAEGVTGSLSKVTGGLVDMPDYLLYQAAANFTAAKCTKGDVLEVYASTEGNDLEFFGYYTVKSIPTAEQLILDGLYIPIELPAASIGNLTWRVWKVIRNAEPLDCEIEYQRGSYLVGPESNPFPLGADRQIWTYAVLRDTPDNEVVGYSLSGFIHSGSLETLPKGFNLPNKHIIKGSVFIRAMYESEPGVYTVMTPAQEGIYYSVDYVQGVIYQLKPWYVYSAGRVDYQFREEVLTSVGGIVGLYTTATDITQLSLWAPEVMVDKYTLYYNYGSLLNRFKASSETYKEYLRGIVGLYVNGPVLKRMESALNVAAGFPVIGTNNEVFKEYTSGVWAQGTDASITAANSTVVLDPVDYIFEEDDVGGYMILSGSGVPEADKGTFQIVNVNLLTNAATVAATYGLVNHPGGVEWVLTRTNEQTVSTSARTYTYAYGIPMRTDIQDPANNNKIVFQAFDTLTTVFSVVDYVEDPMWWHEALIPQELWDDPSSIRRTAYTRLVEHIFDPGDTARFDDPGLYFDANDSGAIMAAGEYGVTPIQRHSAAYVLFDKYLKMHTFKVHIDADVPLLPEFRNDLEDLILVAKPAYTYPFVGLANVFIDAVTLTDEFIIANIGITLGSALDGYSDTIFESANQLRFDDPAPFNFDDFFAYEAKQTYQLALPQAVTQGTVFTIPVIAGAGMVALHINATTLAGLQVTEGTDYTVNWRRDAASIPYPGVAWRITLLTDWTPLVAPLTIDYWQVLRTNGNITNYESGWNPILVDGTNPWYIRSGALNPNDPGYVDAFAALRLEHVERPIQITIPPGE